jgi:hypothetical protein
MMKLLSSLERAAAIALSAAAGSGRDRTAEDRVRDRPCFPDSAAPSDGCMPASPSPGDGCFPDRPR